MLISNPVKIGIRPVIDGRWMGIREGLEEKTIEMARAAKKLIQENLKYKDGTPVQCVIADQTIGGGYEAALCQEKFKSENVCATLSVTPCWCYGSETMDLDPLTIKAVWGFNGTERPGAVYLAAVMAAHAQRGLPAFSIYGQDVQDLEDNSIPKDVQKKILDFARAAVAVGTMKDKSYVAIGSVCMGIAGSFLNPELLQKHFGMRAEWVDMTEVTRRIERKIYDPVEFEKALEWTKKNCPEGKDINVAPPPHSREEKDKEWKFVVKMALIIRDIMVGNPKLAEMGWNEEAMGKNAIAAGFQGQRQWTDHNPNADFPEAILNSSFDWNGTRSPYIIATENDVLNGFSMLFIHLLTNQAALFSDVRTYWSPDSVKRVTDWQPIGKAKNGFIHLINSGASTLDATGQMKDKNGNSVMKPFWEINDDDVETALKATKWPPANVGYFRGGGFSSKFRTVGEMPVTMTRLNMIDGIGPVLQIAEGYTVDLPDDVDKILWERTDQTWPSTWFAPNITGKGAFKDVYSVMANWGANHGAITYGHIGDKLITLSSMIRIPVSMHNVEEDRIYRPHAWAAFGTKDIESADYRACKTYGPMYK